MIEPTTDLRLAARIQRDSEPLASKPQGPKNVGVGAVAELLRPGLRQITGDMSNGAPVALDLQPDWVEAQIVVKGRCEATSRDSSFVISHSEILDRSYLSTFKKRVTDLIDFLRYGPTAQGAVL